MNKAAVMDNTNGYSKELQRDNCSGTINKTLIIKRGLLSINITLSFNVSIKKNKKKQLSHITDKRKSRAA